ncbi:MAG: class I SAM-dependent methyltransferase [Planctomycetota bacterium]|nr:MAG: class I SAM-dependent methyltransferase [Planctomycetota bacterium]
MTVRPSFVHSCCAPSASLDPFSAARESSAVRKGIESASVATAVRYPSARKLASLPDLSELKCASSHCEIVMTEPTGYDSWADLYDELYESAFGAMYSSMTAGHLRLVADRHSKVIDIGAGTGRLSIALAQAGCAVTAIEPSAGMLRGLEKKAIDAGCRDRIQVVQACMHDCVCHPSVALDHDVAFCLFTTIHHVLTLESLELTMTAIARALKSGAIAFVGVHPRYVFEQFRGGMNQSVVIARLGGTVQWTQSAVAMQGNPHLLDTRCVLRLPDGREITDLLVTRPWTVEEITSAASRANLTADGTAGMIGTEEVLRFVKM